jgi:hypothetical protein
MTTLLTDLRDLKATTGKSSSKGNERLFPCCMTHFIWFPQEDHRLKPVDELCLTGMFLYTLCQWIAGWCNVCDACGHSTGTNAEWYAASRAESEWQGLKKLNRGPGYISGLGASCGHAQNSSEIFAKRSHPLQWVCSSPLGSSDPFYLRFAIGISMILLFNKIAKNMDTERIVVPILSFRYSHYRKYIT